MASHKTQKNTKSSPENQESTSEIKETLKAAKNDSSVTAATKKEKQPVTPDDLSAIHNTHEVGTSGGDQRARDAAEEGQPDS